MTTNRKLTIAIIVLLVLNLIILGFFMTSHKNERRGDIENRQGRKQIVIERLDFNDEQVAAFNMLITEHRKRIKDNDSAIRTIKTNIFNALGDDRTANIDSMASKIGDLQEHIEVAHYHHFMKVKALCKDEQIEKFNALSKDLSKMFSRKGHTSKKHK